ncbi:ABC transporter permease [Pelagibius sp. Alg239-R121]|uniref:ABC transporter permease n=1 Tax=Pelagibius sp. Alg239-R121 TaxID=2993448 RepID=UPI0024A6D33D|nr:ABC transporter permease [Pelagibius sp. Alg239-R121]
MLKFVETLYLFRSLWAVLAALLVGALLISMTEVSAWTAYRELFSGAFFDYYGVASTLVKMSPILLAGLAVVIPLRAGLFNIGAEGQIYIGALTASMAALYLPEMPAFIHISIVVVAGAMGGGLWGFIPGYLKAYHGINEVIVTILMNYVGINLVSFFAGGPMMQEGAPYPYSPEIAEHLWLPWIMDGTDAHAGVLVGIFLAFVVWVAMRYTTIGFALDTVGKNLTAARYAGINVKRQILVSMFVAGAIAGLAGTFEVIGLKYRLYHMFSPGYGYDGIVVAFLAGLNPVLVPLSALFLSGLKAGAHIMQRATGLESTVIDAIQGLVIIFVAASLAFRFDRTYWRRVLDSRKALHQTLEQKT